MRTTAKGAVCMVLAVFLVSCAAVERVVPDFRKKSETPAPQSHPAPSAGKKSVEKKADAAKPSAAESPDAPAALPSQGPEKNLLSPGEAEAATAPAPAPEKKERREKSDASIFDSF